MKRFLVLFACSAGLALGAYAAPANCEDHAETIKFAAAGGVRTVKLVPEFDPDWVKEDGGSAYDETQGVYFFKAKLERGKAYTVWTEGLGTNETVSVMTYAADSDDDDQDGPSADFDEIDEPGNDQRYILYADDWYVDDEDSAESDPKSWTYYIEINGDVGDTVTVKFQLGVVIPQGREDNPLLLTPSVSGGTVKRSLQTENEYHMRARLLADRMYWFGTSGGSSNNVLSVTIDGEDPSDESKEAPECDVYDDPAYDLDEDDSGYYVVPRETGYFSIVVSGDDPEADDDVATGAPFALSHRLLATRPLVEHAVTDLEVGGDDIVFTAGALSPLDRTTNGVFDAIIDESLFRFTATKGARYIVETTDAATNLLMRVYDAKGGVLNENTGDGEGLNARCAFVASADGVYHVGVCQNLQDLLNEEPSDTTARIRVARAEAVDGDPDAWDAVDDVPAGASALTPVPGTNEDTPEGLDSVGHGWHRLGRTDWSDVYRIAARKGVAYSLRATLQDPEAAFNSLAAEVFSLSGTTEKPVTTEGDVNAGSGIPLTFTATANATYYVRLSVAEGRGLDHPAYKLHAMGYSPDGKALGALTVNTHGTTAGTFSLGSETVKYPGGSSVLVSGDVKVRFGAVAGFSTPAVQAVAVAAGTTPTVVDVYYSDTFDPKDDAAATATALALKNVETTYARTLWPTDAEDNFSFAGVDGYFYDIALRDVTGDAVFSITNAQTGVVVEDATSVRRIALPKTAAKYVLTVKHGTQEKAGGSYTLAGFFANVGAIKFAKTAVAAKENAASVAITVNRTAKDGVVRVKYATVDGTAKAGAEYVAQSGVLEWPAGDNKAKTIAVKLIPDLVSVYEENKTFGVKLEPMPAEELGANEYPASILGGDTCTVTLTEVSKPGTTVESTYAAKAAKAATVATENVPLSSGTFFGVLKEEDGVLTNGLPALASVTFTASSATVSGFSAKVMLAGKTYTFKGQGWDVDDGTTCSKTLELVHKVNNVAYTSTLAIEVPGGKTAAEGDWLKSGGNATLTMNVPDANGKGVQAGVVYRGAVNRQNAKIQGYLTALASFAGYYTVALAPKGVTLKDGVPAGNGYLTIAVDNKGTAKIAGLLADGSTKVSLSVSACALVEDHGSANGFAMVVPVYQCKAPHCFGGVLRLYAAAAENLPSGAPWQIVVDAKSHLLWNNDNAALTYGGKQGFGLDLEPCGGWYDTVFNLQTYYLGSSFSVGTADVAEFPKEPLAAGFAYSTKAQPGGLDLEFTGDAPVHAKQTLVKDAGLVDFSRSLNPCNVAVKFARATGIYTGTCSLWSENEAGTVQKEVKGLKFAGVFLLARGPEGDVLEQAVGAGAVTQTATLRDGAKTRKWTFSAPFDILAVEE